MKIKENPFCERKKNNINTAQNILRSMGGEMKEKKFIAFCVMHFGIKEQTARGYLKALIDSDFVSRRGDRIKLNTAPLSHS